MATSLLGLRRRAPTSSPTAGPSNIDSEHPHKCDGAPRSSPQPALSLLDLPPRYISSSARISYIQMPCH